MKINPGELFKVSKIDFFSITIRFVSAFSVLISNIIVSRLFTSNELSMYYLLIPFSTIFSMIFISPISIFKINKSIESKNNIYENIFEYLLVLVILGFIFSSLIFFLNQEFSLKLYFSVYLFFEVTVGTIIGIIIQNESFYGKVTNSAFISFIVSTTSIIFPLFYGYFFSWKLNSWLIGLSVSRLSHVIVLIIILRNYFKINSLQIKAQMFILELINNWTSILKLAFNSMISWLHQNSGKFIITTFLGLSFSAPYLYIISISSTMASVLEGIFKPILDRNIFNTINPIENKKNKVELLYLLMGFVGFFSLPIIGNFISKNRYEIYMNLSRITFVFEISKLYMYYKLSIFQIKFGYNKTLIINLTFLFFYLVLAFIFIYISSNLFSFYLLFTSLFFLVLLLIRKIPAIQG